MAFLRLLDEADGVGEIILDGHAATGNNWRKSRSAIGDYYLVPYKSDLTKTTSTRVVGKLNDRQSICDKDFPFC
jgi:hypothetical protein